MIMYARNILSFHWFSSPTSGQVSPLALKLRHLFTTNSLSSEVIKEEWALLKGSFPYTKKGAKEIPTFVFIFFNWVNSQTLYSNI